ncbi:sugar ABC transporter ATP-binding protein [Tranquillimonas rosea]|uniref:sugar ABC transporter ATP-binding protein n=1 Tax=Tranquillimonas rosea TaxID=641238 RepID=UPI003BAA8E2C
MNDRSREAHDAPSVVALDHISKSFAGVRALDDVSLAIRPGEVVCLAGENGSGKSTLIKALSGAQPAESGTVSFHGQPQAQISPIGAVRAGVQVIYQDFSLFPNLTVAENIAFNDRLVRGTRWIDWREMRRTAEAALGRIGVDIPLDAVVEDLPVASKQLVAIARALVDEARLIVMDEPTAALTEREVKHLLGIISRLKERGIAVLFVSHKLAEVFSVCERVVVLRNGRLVAEGPVDEFDPASLTHHMTGRELDAAPVVSADAPRGSDLLQVRHLSREGAFSDVSLDLAAGESLGIVGLLGSGRSELAKALFGMDPASSGTIRIEGEEARIDSISDAMERGIAYVPEDRLTEGLFLTQSIGANIAAGSFRRLAGSFGLVRKSDIREEADGWVERLSIATPSSDLPVSSLSGGNQQRVMLARWLATTPRILILNGPTVGVDVGSKADIHRTIADLAAEGLGVIVISDDLPEVLACCNRIMVMRDGRIVDERRNDDVTENELSHLLSSDAEDA